VQEISCTPRKSDEEQDQYTAHRLIVPLHRCASGRLIETLEEFLKLHRIQKFRERQESAEWTEALAAILVARIGADFSRLLPVLILTLIYGSFYVILLLSFNRMGYLLAQWVV